MNITFKIKIARIVILALFAASFKTEFTPVVKINSLVNSFSLKDTNGKIISINDFKKVKGVIVIFTCNRCPFAKLYVDRMNQLNKKYTSKGFPLIAINSTDAIDFPEENMENMKKYALAKKFNFPYLKDFKQEVAKCLGANKTPHAFILLKSNKQWQIKYSGAIDDNGAEPQKVENNYLENAINELILGKSVTLNETKSIGCSIKYKTN
jgi:peroxiredoxin